MNNKYMPCLIACVVALLGYLFLPYVSISAFGVEVSMSLMDAISEGGGLGDGPGTLPLLITIAGGAIGIAGSLLKKKGTALLGSIAGAVGVVWMILAMTDTLGADLGDLFEFLGIAFWVGLIGFVAAAVLAGNVKDNA